ncbi:MAG: hypothetical protein K0M45_07435 [Candidatus Paracaedibacteraceae bacterium]|nr:hypothetical protein [Candidatus Paracaedibacteraceae bacterium]
MPTAERGRGILVASNTNACGIPTEPRRWFCPGINIHPAEVKILSTPIPEPSKPILEGFGQAEILTGPILEGYDHLPPNIENMLEGFDIYNGPRLNVLTNDNAEAHTSTQTTSGSEKWIREPSSIQDQMALEAAKKDAGEVIIENLNDPHYKGMDKMEYRVKSANGKDSVVQMLPRVGYSLN